MPDIEARRFDFCCQVFDNPQGQRMLLIPGVLGPCRVAPAVAAAEAVALVDGHDDERLAPEAGPVQLVDEPPEQLVGEARLQQVPLPGLLRKPLVPPRLLRAARCPRDRG